MPYIWDELEQWTAEVEIVGEGILDGKKVLAVRYGPVTEWLSPEKVHETINEKLMEKENFSRRKFSVPPKAEKEYVSTKDCPSILFCPKCGKEMRDVFKIRTQKGSPLKNPVLLDSVCRNCGYSLSGVKIPKGKLIEKIK
jgi:hypothetical protein